ncbi:MAG: DUF1292 domain-containing protein [Eubacterium sp.]|nr:DUF1292 domain-containing protein [Eubacterium sp.]
MKMSEEGRIVLTADDGSEEAFFVLEKAEIAGASYLLVTDNVEEEDAEALILKEQQDGDVVVYEVVDDEQELTIISKYFEELLSDIQLNIE